MNRVLATAAILSLTLAPWGVAQAQTTPATPPSSGTSSDTNAGGMSSGNMTSGGMTGQSSGQNAATMHATPDQVKQVQTELKSEGLYKGRVDGEAGPQTMAALSTYQKNKGLQPTGTLDQQTLNSLMGSGSSSGTQQQ